MRGRQRITAVLAALVLGVAFVAAPSSTAQTADQSAPAADFNGDGYGDLVVGIPLEDVGDHEDAGAVEVIYGTANGLNGDQPLDDQFWHQDSSGIGGVAEEGDEFGRAVAQGDFDADGFDDLAVGVPGEDIVKSSGTLTDVGVINVLYGTDAGLTAARDQMFSQNTSGIGDAAQSDDRFGFSLTAGDFDGDGADDLAVGAPGEDIRYADEGEVHVLYGVAGAGLRTGGSQTWYLAKDGVIGFDPGGERFGNVLTAGDFDGSGHDDLVVGTPFQIIYRETEAGAVNVIYGSPYGLTITANQQWDQNDSGIDGVAERDDHFGTAIAAGDFDGDAADDLAVGVPGEDLAGKTNAGAVNVIYGTSTYGLSATGDQVWYLGTTGVPGDPGNYDDLGGALATGSFGNGSGDDLAVGIPGRDVWENSDGALVMIYGSSSGLAAANSKIWNQDTGLEGDPEDNDRFGAALAAGNLGLGSYDDLAVGVPGESYESSVPFPHTKAQIGAVNVIYGASTGLSTSGEQFWWQRSDALHDSGEGYDRFGTSLA